MAVCTDLAGNLNRSERARTRLSPIVAKLHGLDEQAGYQVESIFGMFWQLARKADDMMDYSGSSDLKWLQVLQQVFRLCCTTQELPPSISAESWLKTTGHFFNLMSRTCGGEVEDLMLSNKPSESSYYRMALLKTGPWFTGRIACASIATGNAASQDLLEYGDLTCLAYQIRNDIRDAETEGKDIEVGKLNFPAVLLLQNPCRIDQAVEKAAAVAGDFENRARKIARRYGSEMELLTAQLCSA